MDLVGRQVAAAGSSQNRCVEVIADRTGVKIGHEKLRKLSSMLADSMEPHREACQCEQLQKWIDQAEENGKNIVLSVSRDGVSLGIAPFGYFEMASVATLSVFSEGKRLGTLYMAAAPEENQATLSKQLTSLLSGIIRVRGEKLAKIVYVTDAGKVETIVGRRRLGASDAIDRENGRNLRSQESRTGRVGESEAISSPLPPFHELRRATRAGLSDRQRDRGIGLQTNRERQDEAVGNAMETHRGAARNEIAFDPVEPDLGVDVQTHVTRIFASHRS